MIELKSINNSHVTIETLKAFNEWLSDIYNCRIGYIDNIMCFNQYAAETSWKNTTLSLTAVLNNIPMWYHRLLVQFLKNGYQRRMSLNNQIQTTTGQLHYATCLINLRTEQTLGLEEDAVTGNTLEAKASHGEIKIPIPEGYDGNTAFVELIVPKQVISALHFRKVDDASWAQDAVTYFHPLAKNDYGYNYDYGYMRPHALLFYQRYTKKDSQGRNTLKIDVAKSKGWVTILTHADIFTGPFNLELYALDEDPIEPWVEVHVTCYKYGVM